MFGIILDTYLGYYFILVSCVILTISYHASRERDLERNLDREIQSRTQSHGAAHLSIYGMVTMQCQGLGRNGSQEYARPDQVWRKRVSILVPGISVSSVMDN